VADGVRKTVEWYLSNRDEGSKRYNVFYQKSFLGA